MFLIKCSIKSLSNHPDKDLLGLEGTHYNPKQNIWVTTSRKEEHLIFWKSMICGDTADNIKGLPGKGEKFFNKLIEDIPYLDTKFFGSCVSRAYVEYYNYNYEKALDEFYKNFKTLKLKDNLIIDFFIPIEWKKEVISDLEFDID